MKQASALNILKTGQNVFLTGQAGAGKTYVLNQYIRYLRAHHVSVAITASTGIAATHMNGMTIHSWSGMGIKEAFNDEDFKKLKTRKNVIERIKSTKVLIIDEISMLHARQVDLLDTILQKVRENNRPFGGLQVVFAGDFFQLPPVGKKGENNKDKFAFMSKAWLRADFQVCYLSEQHRQTAEDEHLRYGISLNAILNQIRAQYIDINVPQILLSTKNNEIDITRTRLYTHNASVDQINAQELNALTTPLYTFNSSSYGDPVMVDNLKKGVRAPDTLELKVGAKVMFVKNNTMLEVYNGTMGVVTGFGKISLTGWEIINSPTAVAGAIPMVRLNTGREVIAEPEEWVIEDHEGKVLASYSQIPLCLAWAITVHKSQGMTLDAAEMDLSRTFEVGQGYVALSRLRGLDGLKLLGMNQNTLKLDEWVYRIDKRLLELSAIHDAHHQSIDDDTMVQLHQKFIKTSDSHHNSTANNKAHLEQKNTFAPTSNLIDNSKSFYKEFMAFFAQEIHKDTPTTNTSNNDTQTTNTTPTHTKVSTYDETKALIQDGLDIATIAQRRNLAKSTITEHLVKLIKTDGVEPYRHLAPSDSVMADIKHAYDKLEAQGVFDEKIEYKAILATMEVPCDHQTLKIALAFIEHGSNGMSTRNDD